jgi:hypothetical protein
MQSPSRKAPGSAARKGDWVARCENRDDTEVAHERNLGWPANASRDSCTDALCKLERHEAYSPGGGVDEDILLCGQMHALRQGKSYRAPQNGQRARLLK